MIIAQIQISMQRLSSGLLKLVTHIIYCKSTIQGHHFQNLSHQPNDAGREVAPRLSYSGVLQVAVLVPVSYTHLTLPTTPYV